MNDRQLENNNFTFNTIGFMTKHSGKQLQLPNYKASENF